MKCGECCKNYPYVELSQEDINSLALATGLHYAEFANSKAKKDDGSGYFLQFKENGHCLFLTEINGSYSCGVYAARPVICARYPSRPIEMETCAAKQALISEKLFSRSDFLIKRKNYV